MLLQIVRIQRSNINNIPEKSDNEFVINIFTPAFRWLTLRFLVVSYLMQIVRQSS